MKGQPFIPPNLFIGEKPELVTNRDKARRLYRKKLFKQEKAPTYRVDCRVFIDALYLTPRHKAFLFDVRRHNGGMADIVVSVRDGSKNEFRKSVISVRAIVDCAVSKRCVDLGDFLATVCKPGGNTTRSKSVDLGSMFCAGTVYSRGAIFETLPQCPEQYQTQLTENVREFCIASADMCSRVFPHRYNVIRQMEACAGVVPTYVVGGERGVCASMNFSVDLANSSHFDPNDACQGFAVWAEKMKGKAKNWYFFCPNVRVHSGNDKVYDGLVIQLFHGVSIAWNGALVRHATARTEAGSNNRCYAGHFCPSARLMRAKRRQQQKLGSDKVASVF
jgi:hypothetical protein